MWTSYDGRGGDIVWIMNLNWEFVRFATRISSMNVDVDSSRDSNVGVRARTVELRIRDALPTARKMAESHGVASMTAQRALRELQNLGLTYAVVGKGTFVYPLARERAGTEGQPDPARGALPAWPTTRTSTGAWPSSYLNRTRSPAASSTR